MNWFKRVILRKSEFPVAKHEICHAFTCGGKEYFEFVDFNNIPTLRGLKTMVFFEEMRMKCTLEFLKLHVEAVENILTGGNKINVFEIKKLNDQLKQRLEMALDTELIYKIASVVFFDKDEAIDDYDFGYNLKKIEKWKAEMGTAFFLLQPIRRLMPVLEDIGENLKMYSQVVEELNQLHLDNLLSALPQKRTQTLKDKSYLSLAVIPQK